MFSLKHYSALLLFSAISSVLASNFGPFYLVTTSQLEFGRPSELADVQLLDFVDSINADGSLWLKPISPGYTSIPATFNISGDHPLDSSAWGGLYTFAGTENTTYTIRSAQATGEVDFVKQQVGDNGFLLVEYYLLGVVLPPDGHYSDPGSWALCSDGMGGSVVSAHSSSSADGNFPLTFW